LNVAKGCLQEQWGPARLIVKEFPQVTHTRLTSSGRGGTNPPDRREGMDSEVEQTAQKEFVQVEVANSWRADRRTSERRSLIILSRPVPGADRIRALPAVLALDLDKGKGTGRGKSPKG